MCLSDDKTNKTKEKQYATPSVDFTNLLGSRDVNNSFIVALIFNITSHRTYTMNTECSS
jgi:hypothetical protein